MKASSTAVEGRLDPHIQRSLLKAKAPLNMLDKSVTLLMFHDESTLKDEMTPLTRTWRVLSVVAASVMFGGQSGHVVDCVDFCFWDGSIERFGEQG